MVRTQIQLTEEQARQAKRHAADEGISLAEYIRRALDARMESRLRPSREELRQRALEAIGSFASDATDVSERHDDYLAEAYSQ